MGMIILAGDDYNAAAGGTFTASPAADALFPGSAAADGDPGTIFRSTGTTAAELVVNIGDGLAGHGNLDTWHSGAPDGFALSGTVTQETVDVHTAGGSAAKFVPGVGNVAALEIIATVRTGQARRLSAWMKAATTGLLQIGVQDLTNGKRLNTAGQWVTAGGFLAAITQTGSSYAEYALNYVVQSFADLLSTTTTLSIIIRSSNTATASFLDDLMNLPGVDIVSVHGHNVEAGVALQLHSSTDNFSTSDTTEGTFTLQVGAFFMLLPAKVYRRYWKLLANGEQSARSGPFYVGEWVLSQAFTLNRGPDFPSRLKIVTPQVRVPLAAGGVAAYGLSRGAHNTRMELDYRGAEADYLQYLYEVVLRSAAGAPAVVIPDSANPRELAMGVLPESMDVARLLKTFRDMGTILVDALPLPLVDS